MTGLLRVVTVPPERCSAWSALLRVCPPAVVELLGEQEVADALEVLDEAATGGVATVGIATGVVGRIAGAGTPEPSPSSYANREQLTAREVAVRYDVPLRTVNDHLRRGWLLGWRLGDGRWLVGCGDAQDWAGWRGHGGPRALPPCGGR